MRILYDTRSVRTTTGAYIMRGLTRTWLADPRVTGVFAAVVPSFDVALLPAGVSPVQLPQSTWLRHVTNTIVRSADRVGADVIFCANGTGPRDPRAVLYFQDLHHFGDLDADIPLRTQFLESLRAGWRSLTASASALGVGVSRTIVEKARDATRGLTIIEIPNGVEVDDAWWNGEEDVVYVAGGIGARKSEETALHAWALLQRNPPRGRMEIGGVEPAVRRDILNQIAADLGLTDSVTIHGAVPRSRYLERIARSRLTVSCSRFESFGLPVAEALAMGAPVVCSDIPAHRELVARAGAGEAFPAGDATALAARLRQALQGDLPRRLSTPPLGWDWATRGREHIDAYTRYVTGAS